MIKLVNFLLLIERIIDYKKKDIDEGKTPPLIYKICACIRETFCLSYTIRKNNNLYLYFQSENILIKFEGSKLRYLGPDERSQTLLLKKALDKANQLINSEDKNWIKSTMGIYAMSLKSDQSFMFYLNSMNIKNLILIYDSISPHKLSFLAHTYEYHEIKKLKNLENLNEIFFLLPINISNNILIEFIKLLVQIFPSLLENITLTSLNKIKAIEDKILYINFKIDQEFNEKS